MNNRSLWVVGFLIVGSCTGSSAVSPWDGRYAGTLNVTMAGANMPLSTVDRTLVVTEANGAVSIHAADVTISGRNTSDACELSFTIRSENYATVDPGSCATGPLLWLVSPGSHSWTSGYAALNGDTLEYQVLVDGSLEVEIVATRTPSGR